MATVNIGSLKFNWKGSYNGSTAYSVDDVTSYNGSSYICILASTGNLPTNTTYFQPMATAGTDVGTTITTQGDILYRDGSGLARLGAGVSGQFLKTQGTSANPVWAAADSGKTLGVTQYEYNTRTSLAAVSAYNFANTNYTQIKANSKLIIDINLIGYGHNNGSVNFDFNYDGTDYRGFGMYTYTAQNNPHAISYKRMIPGASTTGSKNWYYQYHHANSSTGAPFNVWNPNATDDGRLAQTVSTIIITEVDF